MTESWGTIWKSQDNKLRWSLVHKMTHCVCYIAWEIWQQSENEMTKFQRVTQIQTESHLHQFCIMSHSLFRPACPQKLKEFRPIFLTAIELRYRGPSSDFVGYVSQIGAGRL